MSPVSLASIIALVGATAVPAAKSFAAPTATLPGLVQVVPESPQAVSAEQLVAPVKPDNDDPHARYDLAKDLAGQGNYEESLQEYLWVWRTTRDKPSWLGVRHSFLLSDMDGLAASYPPAREAFVGLVDAAQANMEVVSPITWLDWIEWTSLCDRFTGGTAKTRWFDPPRDGQRRIVGWYERHRDAAGRISMPVADAKVQARIESDLFGLLVAQRRFVDAVSVGGDLVGRAKEEADSLDKLGQAARAGPAATDSAAVDQLLASSRSFFLERQAPVYGVLLAAGEEEAARAFATAVIDHLDTAEARVALVQAALDLANSRSPQLEAWLDEAFERGADVSTLRSRLDAGSAPR